MTKCNFVGVRSVDFVQVIVKFYSSFNIQQLQAAVQEKYADNSIGNVTGSNSVNVFLGLGLPWTIAAIYWAAKGETFKVCSLPCIL